MRLEPFKAFGIATQEHTQKHECNELSKTPLQKYFSLRKFLGWKATQVVLKFIIDYIHEGRLVASLESVETLRQVSVGCQARTSNGLLILAGFLSLSMNSYS